MAAVTEKHTGAARVPGYRCTSALFGNMRFQSPMAQLNISPYSSMNESALNEQPPSPSEDRLEMQLTQDDTRKEAVCLAEDYIRYKIEPKMMTEATSDATKTLRRVGDELIDRHQITVNAMAKRLHCDNRITVKQYEQQFMLIANEICKDGQENWGRIVTLYVLAAILALNDVNHGNGANVDNIINFVGNYVGEHKKHWIEKSGGWKNFVKFFDNGSEDKKVWKGIIYTAVGLGALGALAVGRQ